MTIGTLSIGIIFGASIFIEGTLKTASDLAGGVADVLNRTSIDINVIKEYLSNTILSLNWAEPFEALGKLINLDFIKEVFQGMINLISSDLAPYASELDALVSNAISSVVNYFTLAMSLVGLSLFCGYYLTRWLIRKNMAKRSVWKMLLSVIVDIVLSVGLFFLCAWLTLLWTPSAILSTLVILIIFGSVTLLKAYLIHAKGKVTLKEILNAKNVLSLLAVDFIIFVFTFVLVIIVSAATNIVTGIYVGIGLIEIGFIVISLNAESYVLSLVNNLQQTPLVITEESNEQSDNIDKKLETEVAITLPTEEKAFNNPKKFNKEKQASSKSGAKNSPEKKAQKIRKSNQKSIKKETK